ncbi:HNH endonuclease signature motif containing protein [Escherichia coli]|uniref:HNH endonuclease signature motif containing protein n=1 Tax=Escherichia coli TaxID=562 RepID=UPI000D0F1B56|nr:HNH endonuclease signature motif containing protein [Escherichia coli]HBN1734919.1 HNH endonuclease [Escherichia coli]HDP9854592.1 HNH endonuclease [Escherichia coli]
MTLWKQTQYVNYEVSSNGEVRNTKTGNYLTQSYSKSNGYYKVTLTVYEDGKSKSYPIETHRLVAETFLSKPQTNKRLVVDNINSDKRDNNISNLQWITYSENSCKAVRKKQNEPRLTPVQKDEVKALYTGGMSCINITLFMNEKYNRSTHRQTYTKVAKDN